MIGFHCAHEQFSPSFLLNIVQRAESAGFKAAMCSDHITPWSKNQGHSGHTWSWLGAAMQGTALSFGSMAIPGGWRYHPAVLAQTIATLAEMFPGRLRWVAAGSGEALNEHVTGEDWPEKEIRNRRLESGVKIIRRLWQGEEVTDLSGPVKTDRAKIWSLPNVNPAIYGAALTPETAFRLGGWADGLLTVQKPPEELQKLINAFRDGGGSGKPVVLQMHVSWDTTDEQARYNAWDQWRNNTKGPVACANLVTPEDFDRVCADVKPEDMDEVILISADLNRHVEWIRMYRAMGINEIYIHNAGKNQMAFIDGYQQSVLPFLEV
ncbi:MAG: N5,N10-methylene tetrahydromethanopterin reductase [Micavibrio sp.]|nr:N5,N10-methylene tetrahydromethanopterin reductase [Micavibrio sp.]